MNELKKKTPPHNKEAEQAVIGGLMLNQEAWEEISFQLFPSDFYFPAHQKIFQTLVDLHNQGKPTDAVMVADLLQKRNHLDEVGGLHYIGELCEQTASTAIIDQYSKILREKTLRRKMILVAQEIVDDGYSEAQENVEGYLEKAESTIYKVSEMEIKKDPLTSAADIVKVSLDKIEELAANQGQITGIPSGFNDLDEMLAGFHEGELSIIAARPSMGKTAFSLNVALHAALEAKKNIAYFSVEMPKEQMMMRMIASHGKVFLSQLRNGQLDDKCWPRMINASAQLSESGLYIDDTPGISPFEIRSRARKLKSRAGLDMIIIDYLQLMSMKQKVESREREVAEISKSLKALAKELRIPVVALAQLNRGVEGRTDRRPMLSDLRESGSIEQDADVIMMLFRNDYYDRDNPTGLAEVIVGKQRNGPTGTVQLRWRPEFGLFENNIEGQLGPAPPVPNNMPPQRP